MNLAILRVLWENRGRNKDNLSPAVSSALLCLDQKNVQNYVVTNLLSPLVFKYKLSSHVLS